MQAVAAIAYFISVWLRSAGIEIDPVLAQRGGLLHDMAKLQERSRGALEKDHGELSAEILVNLNQPLLAEIAKRHLLSCILDDQRKPQTWEQKVVYLADKLVEGSVLVTISERLGALERRYGIGEVYSQPVFDLQAELCKILQVTPDAWISHIRAALEENYSPI